MLFRSDIPPFSVAVGNPCRVIRSRFTPEIIERIQRLRWFDYDWRDQQVDWRTPETSLDAMEAALSNGFNRRFEVFRYVADGERIKFERKAAERDLARPVDAQLRELAGKVLPG